MKKFNFPIDNLKKGWGNEFSPPHLPSVMLVIWHVLRLPFSLFHFSPTGLRVSDAALSRWAQKITQLYELGALKRRTGLALARLLGWVSILVTLFFPAGAYEIQLVTGSSGPNWLSRPNHMAVSHGILYFQGWSSFYGDMMYAYDANNHDLTSIYEPLPIRFDQPRLLNPHHLTNFQDKLYFVATPEIAHCDHCYWLWSFDGTTVVNLYEHFFGHVPTNQLMPSEMLVFNNKLYYVTDAALYGKELWVFDGTNAPHLVMENLTPHEVRQGSFPQHLTVFDNKLYFSATDEVHGRELWVYDGITSELVHDIQPGTGDSNPAFLTVFDNNLYFSANDGTLGNELWKFDGISASIVHDIYTGSSPSDPKYLTVFDNKLYFNAADEEHEYALWVHDSTNTLLFHDFANPPRPSNLTVFHNKLYFGASDGTHGFELWSYDGTTVSMLEDLRPGALPSTPMEFIEYDNKLFFNARRELGYEQLWYYDDASKLPNNITDFPNPGTKTFSAPPFTLTASADSGLPVFFSSATTTVCTVNGDTVTILSGGVCTITASQAGDTSYFPAQNVSQTFSVTKLANNIIFPNPGYKESSSSPFTLTASVDSGLVIYFSSSTPDVCSVNSLGMVTVNSEGVCTITASQPGDAGHYAATDVSQSFFVGDITINSCSWLHTGFEGESLNVTSNCALSDDQHFSLAIHAADSTIHAGVAPPSHFSPLSPQVHQAVGYAYLDSYISSGVDCDLLAMVDFPSMPSTINFSAFTKYCYYVKTDTHYILLSGSTKGTIDSEWTADSAEFIHYHTNEHPSFTSPSYFFAEENQTSITTITATDPEGADILFSLSDGHDAASFSINPSTGVLTFKTAPDFETKSRYFVRISISDGPNTKTDGFGVHVTNAAEDFAIITAPIPGATLAAGEQVFSWSSIGAASNYWLQIGTSEGRNNLYDSGPLDGTNTSTTVDYLPTDGSTIYVRVWSYNNGKWASQDQQFTADNSGGVTPPTIGSLNTGETLTSSEQTFTWSDVGASDYWLQIGTSLGRNDIYDSGILTGTEQPVFDLPTDGNPIYVRVWYKHDGRWDYINDHYLAAIVPGAGIPTPPTLTPSNGATLSGTTQTFVLTDNGASRYWLQVGTGRGRNDIYDSKQLNGGENSSEFVSGLPTSGTIYVRVWYYSGGWLYDNLTYTGGP